MHSGKGIIWIASSFNWRTELNMLLVRCVVYITNSNMLSREADMNMENQILALP